MKSGRRRRQDVQPICFRRHFDEFLNPNENLYRRKYQRGIVLNLEEPLFEVLTLIGARMAVSTLGGLDGFTTLIGGKETVGFQKTMRGCRQPDGCKEQRDPCLQIAHCRFR